MRDILSLESKFKKKEDKLQKKICLSFHMDALEANQHQRQINKIDHTQSINSHVNCYGI